MTDTAVSVPTSIDEEIKRLFSVALNVISTRALHPTFGYTKADIREALARVEGALLIRGAFEHKSYASDLLTIRHQADALGLDMTGLHAAIAVRSR